MPTPPFWNVYILNVSEKKPSSMRGTLWLGRINSGHIYELGTVFLPI
jgi:hypothetical protein